MDKPVIKPLTEEDIRDFYGDNIGHHCRGWSIYYRDKLAAIVGITIQPTLMLAWSDIKPDVKASPRVIYETAKIIMRKIIALGYPVVYAVAYSEFKTAPEFLNRLGWEHMESSARGEVFRWVL